MLAERDVGRSVHRYVIKMFHCKIVPTGGVNLLLDLPLPCSKAFIRCVPPQHVTAALLHLKMVSSARKFSRLLSLYNSYEV